MSSETDALEILNPLPDTSVQGDVLYYNGSAWVGLAAGTAGQVLQSGGAGANPSWTAAVPIGTVMAWDKSLPGVPALPVGWVECNGQTLTDAESLLNGQTIRNLNGGNRFLRGNATSGTIGGNDQLTLSRRTDYTTSGSTLALTGIDSVSTGDIDNKPLYCDMVWIMKVK